MDILRIETNKYTYRIYRSVYAPVKSNMYIIIEGKEAIIVDSNFSEEGINLLKKQGVEKVHIFLTHEHYDHSHGVWWLQENFEAKLYCHKNCKDQLSTKKRSSPRLVAFVIAENDKKSGENQYEEFKKCIRDYSLVPNVLFDDSQSIVVAGHHITVHHVPGHSPGSCLYNLDDAILFSGDSLIDGTKIITAFKGGNIEDMRTQTLPKLRSLSDDLWVLPGHGELFKKQDFNFDIYNV